jgi:hypothetical protein
MVAILEMQECAMRLVRWTLWLGGLCFVGFGLASLIDPIGLLGSAGVVLSGDVAATEVRAFYGGLELGLGALLLAADLYGKRREGLWLVLASYGGIALGRSIGLLIAGQGSSFLWFALATEWSLTGLAVLGLRRLGSH